MLIGLLLTLTLFFAGPPLGLVDHQPPPDLHLEPLILTDTAPPFPSDEDAPDVSYAPNQGNTPFQPTRADYGPLVEQWRPLVAGHFPPDQVDTALCIIYHESRGDPSAKNPNSSATGLFQLLKQWHDHYDIDPYIPEQNVYAAHLLYSEPWGGWKHWNPYNQGKCRDLN